MENQEIEVVRLGKEATEAGIMLGWEASRHGHTLEETLEEFRKIWNRKQEENGKRN